MACNMEVPLKLAFTRSGSVVEHRRVRLASPTMASVKATVARQARGSYTLQYTDNEGDLVTMEDEEEWVECVTLWRAGGAACLLLRVEQPGSSRAVATRGRSGSGGGRGGSRRCSRSRSRSGSRRCARRHDGGASGGEAAAVAAQECSGEAAEEAAPRAAASLHRFFARRRSRSGERRRRSPAAERAPREGASCVAVATCKGCEFAVTGVAKEHCCKKCESRPGQHGPRCAQQRTAGAAEKGAGATSSEEDATPEQIAGVTKCKGCDFAVTGVAKEHCCNRCRSLPGQHGPRCAQQRTAAAAEEECGKDTAPEPVTEGTKCKGCDFTVTGVAKEHCCKKCESRPGKHGPRCAQQRTAGAAERGAETTSSEEDATPEQIAGGTKCKGCDFAVTGVAKEHCCKKCKSRPGQHGPRCAQQRTAGATEEDAASEPVTGGTKCKGCDFAVTGVAKEHCCGNCARHPGRHGRRCLQRPQAEAPCLADTSTKDAEGEASCVSGATVVTCKGCDFAVTGVAKEHCCKKCESRPGQHGPRCAQRAVQRTALVEGAAPGQGSEEPACKGCGSAFTVRGSKHYPEHCCGKCARFPGRHTVQCTRVGFTEEPVAVHPTRCGTCEYAATGAAAKHCCKKCARHPGKHFQACPRRAMSEVAAESAAVTETETTETGPSVSMIDESARALGECFGVPEDEARACLEATSGDVEAALQILLGR